MKSINCNLIRNVALVVTSLFCATLLFTHNARAASYGFDQVMVKGKKVNIVWTDLMADGRATAYSFTTPQGTETRIDLDGDGIPEVRTIENDVYEIEQSHPVHGIYSQMRITKHESKRNIISEYRISKNHKSYDLLQSTAVPHETMYEKSDLGDVNGIGGSAPAAPPAAMPEVAVPAPPSISTDVPAQSSQPTHSGPNVSPVPVNSTPASKPVRPSSSQQEVLCELKQSSNPLSGRWQALATSLEEQAFINDPTIKSLVADSCGAEKEKILRSLFMVLVPRAGTQPKYFSCMAGKQDYKTIATEIYTRQWSRVASGKGKSALIGCGQLPVDSEGSFNEGRNPTVMLQASHMQKVDSKRVAETLFHELIHSKITDDAEVSVIVKCCISENSADDLVCNLKTKNNRAAGYRDILQDSNKTAVLSSLRTEFSTISKMVHCQNVSDESKTCTDSLFHVKAQLVSNILGICKATRADLNCDLEAKKFADDPTLQGPHLRKCLLEENHDVSQLGCIYGTSESSGAAFFGSASTNRDILARQPASAAVSTNGRIPMTVVRMNPTDPKAMMSAAQSSPSVIQGALDTAVASANSLPPPQLIAEARADESRTQEVSGQTGSSRNERTSSSIYSPGSSSSGGVSNNRPRNSRNEDNFRANYDGPSESNALPSRRQTITDGTKVNLARAFGNVIPDEIGNGKAATGSGQVASPSASVEASDSVGRRPVQPRPTAIEGQRNQLAREASQYGGGGGGSSDSALSAPSASSTGARSQRSPKRGENSSEIPPRKFVKVEDVTALLASTAEPTKLVQLVQQRWFQEQIEKFGIQIVYGTTRYPDHPATPATKIINLALYLQGRSR